MNGTPKGTGTYRDQNILTASPARLVAMLYEAAITALRRAIKAIEAGDVKARWRANKRAVEIIEHLLVTLDTDKGGSIAGDLERLYPFMIRHLINVDLRNDPAPAHEVIGLLEPLLESWRRLDRQAPAGATPAAAVPERDAPPAETTAYDSGRQARGAAPLSRISATA